MMKNKKQIPVPIRVRYLSEWEDFWDEIPDEHCILNKRLTNVGATYYFLETNHKVILACPRCSLLESKKDKHKNAWVYRITSDDISTDNDKHRKPKKATYDDIQRYNADLKNYLDSCVEKGITPHVMTTYDSLGHVMDVLESISPNEFDSWTLVIDEFQSVFADSAYKSTTELNFLHNAQYFKRAVFLSATPFLDEYMEQLPMFKDMKYLELIWPKEMQTDANVINITLGKKESIPGTCKKIIDCMRAGKTVKFGSKEIDTTEAVFYINKVSTIRDIVKKCNLLPSEVNILCAKGDANDAKLKEVGHTRGTFPKPGESNKMFTFTTRSNFLGVDFESDCAYSYVFADPSQKTIALDISTDLSQILGRQRRDTNPYQHEAMLFMKLNSIGADEDEFMKHIKEKSDATYILIKNYDEADDALKAVLIKKWRKSAERDHYCDDYLCVRDDKKTGKPVLEFNTLAMLSEIRAWQIQKKNYTSQYKVIDEQKKSGIKGVSGTKSMNQKVIEFKERFDSLHNTTERIKAYAEFRNSSPQLALEIDFVSHKYPDYWDALGYDNLKNLGCQESKIKAALAAPTPFDSTLDNLILEIRATLTEKKYTLKEVKEKLGKVYKKVGIQKTAVGRDLSKYVTAKPYQDQKTGKKYMHVQSLYQKGLTLFPFVWRPNVSITKGMTIDRILDIIETGKYKISKTPKDSRNLKDVILEIRSLSDHDAQGRLKKDWLPVACINGIFKYKDDHGLVTYSSFIALDYDGFESREQIQIAKDKLKTFPYIYAVFVTPSGMGLKAIVLHDSTNPTFHHNLYMQIMKKCELPQTDSSVSDLSRGQFLSYDNELWRNPDPKPYHFEYDNSIPAKVKNTDVTIEKTDTSGNSQTVSLDTWESEFLHGLWQNILTDDAVIGRLDRHWRDKKPEYYEVGNRHASMLIIAGTLCKAGIPKERTEDYLNTSYPSKLEVEIEGIIEYSYERNAFGCDRRLYK